MAHNRLNTRKEFASRIGTPDNHLELLLDVRDAMVPGDIPDEVFAVVGNAVTVIHPPEGTLAIGVLVEAGSFVLRAGDQGARTVDSVDAAANTLTVSGHGYHNTEDGPVRASTTGTLPAPLTTSGLYYPRVLDADRMELYASRLAAEAGTAPIDLADAGTGTHTLGGTAAEAASTDQDIGDNVITMNAGEGKGNTPITAVFQAFRGGKSITVSGADAGSILKYFVAV